MTPTSVAWNTPSVLAALPDIDALARMADASTRLCEQVTIAGLDFVGNLVLLSTRQAEILSGDRNFEGFWRKESDLVQVFGARIIDCARECGDALLTTAPEGADPAPGTPAVARAAPAKAAVKTATVVPLAPAPDSKASSRVAREKVSPPAPAPVTPVPASAQSVTKSATSKAAAKAPGASKAGKAPQPPASSKRKRPQV